MLFKNVIFYRFTKPFSTSPEDLESALAEHEFQPCGSVETYRMGWTSPLGRHGVQFTHVTQGNILLCLKREEKLLPSTVIKDALAEKVAEIEDQQMRKVRKKEKDEIKEQLIYEMLPKAFTRSRLTYAYISPKDGFIIVDASSPKLAEDLTSFLRKTLGSLPVRIPAVNTAPAFVMTQWIAKDAHLPTGLVSQDDCELRDTGPEGGVVRCKGVALDSDEIAGHLTAGKQVVKLAMEWEENISFLLQEDLSIKRLKFGDSFQEQLDNTEADDAAARLDASFSLMSLELSRLLPALLEAFGGEDTSALIEQNAA
ncbi:MAG: recombination-associated protein RdgC [Hahellaceae bacterium]|nr:recombination-associated protein RdgC [Hahellaceae bacterium]